MNLIILQARMSSTRLPNKVLKQVKNKELLLYQIQRLRKSKYVDKIVVATSIESDDDAIEKFCERENIECFRGDLDDVLSRYYKCALSIKNSNDKLNIIRVTGDCPIIDYEVVDNVIEYYIKHNFDYVSNTLKPTYPDGLDVEVFTFEALEKAYNEAIYKSDREHVTLYIKNNSSFKKFNYKAKIDFSHLRFTIDERKDFELIKNILEYFDEIDFKYLDVISYLTKNPNLLFINSNIQRDEGLIKSLKEDGRI